jgi:hypothetical protein
MNRGAIASINKFRGSPGQPWNLAQLLDVLARDVPGAGKMTAIYEPSCCIRHEGAGRPVACIYTTINKSAGYPSYGSSGR